MKKSINKFLIGFFTAVATLLVAFLPSTQITYADDAAGLAFDEIKVEEAETHKQVADLGKGEIPALKTGITYALNVSYKIPSALQFKPTYLRIWFENGLYVTALPGATFTEGDIQSTSFDKLVKAPTGTQTSPYGYPKLGSEKSRNGELQYRTKNSLRRVDTRAEIRFRVDDAYVNQDAKQMINDAIKLSLGTEQKTGVDARAYTVNPADEINYGFWVEQGTEVVSKGGTTETLIASNAGGGRSLTEANSKTTVEIVYPQDIELVALEETALYKQNGKVVKTVEEGENKVATVEWDEPGSYSGGLTFKPHLKVAKDSSRKNGSSFDVVLRNFHKSIWNDSPNVDRTSKKQIAAMVVTIIDGDVPEKITRRVLEDNPSNWAYKKYDSYNVRLGTHLVKNELGSPTRPKTLEMDIDLDSQAIVRGVTIPYHKDIKYGLLTWKAADGKTGTVDLATKTDILQKSGVAALITNTALGLDIDTSITYIKVDLGQIPGFYDGIKPVQDILENKWNTDIWYIYDEYYGWDSISNGIYGSWKKGANGDIKTSVKLYTTGTTSTDKDTVTTVGKSAAPKVLNGVGNIDKTQINGGDAFKITGWINDGNWDWNPLQEPVLYVIMPEGFSYSGLQVDEYKGSTKLGAAKLSTPEFVGSFEKDGGELKVWKYTIDTGTETRGQYQPDFTMKRMYLQMQISTNKLAAKGVYHINDFLGITTKDFQAIGAQIKYEKWDRANWNTAKYKDLFGSKVNSGETMVSLAEGRGVTVNQASEIAALSTFKEKDLQEQVERVYIYDNSRKQETTAVLQKGDIATVRIGVRNNAAAEVSNTKLFVPLLGRAIDQGPSFTPEGQTQLPLQFVGAKSSANFQIKYIKLNNGLKYERNHAPKLGDYTEVNDAQVADMLLLVSNKPLNMNQGGYVSISYAVRDEVDASYNGKNSVFNSVLDYDIEGNQSTLTLATNAVTFVGIDLELTKSWEDGKDVDKMRPALADFAKYLQLSADAKTLDLSKFVPKIVADGEDKYIVTYAGLPKYWGADNKLITYTLTEKTVPGYVADKNVIKGSGDAIAGMITNVHTPKRPPQPNPPAPKPVPKPEPAPTQVAPKKKTQLPQTGLPAGAEVALGLSLLLGGAVLVTLRRQR